jgi:hypothetical protein
VTHACTALLPAAGLRTPRVGLVVVGAVLPDATGRVFPLGLDLLGRMGLPLPEWATWPWTALHEPFGWALTCALAASAFVEGQRASAFRLLAAGCALHTALDLTQDHHGEGYLLLAPVSTARFELGWIGSEATVPHALPLLAATLVAWIPAAVERWRGVPVVPWLRAGAILIPAHAALPLALGPLAGEPEAVVGALLWLHLAGAGFLLGAWRWWRDQVPQLGALVAADLAAVLGSTALVLGV